MKPLQLTQQQKDNLLEMCTKLYPEYNWTFEPTCELGAYDKEFNHLLYSNKNEKDHLYMSDSIHWFELCYNLIFMVNQVGDFTNDLRYAPEGLVFSKCYEHPVDYLYKHYKDLTCLIYR
jgi:hypothetical protein